MILLWAGLAALTLLALLFVFIPFSRARKATLERVDRTEQNIAIFKERLSELEKERDAGTLEATEFNELKVELEKSLLEDAANTDSDSEAYQVKAGKPQLIGLTAMAVLIPVIGLSLYAYFGSPNELHIAHNRENQPFIKEGRAPTADEAIAMLQSELALNPTNAEGWYVLATTLMNLSRYDEAVSAFQGTLNALPSDAPQYANVMGQYAQSLYFVHGEVNDEVRQQIDLTLERDPLEVTALGLQGIDAFTQKQYTQAIDVWRKALQHASPEAAGSLKNGLRQAVQELELAGEPVPDIPELIEKSVVVSVSIDPELAKALAPDLPVFIFARPVGQRMPLAAMRVTVSDLPLEVTLTDDQAMTPTAKLSSQAEVEVAARIAKSGQPVASSGDLESKPVLVPVSTEPSAQTLVIDQIVQ
jgi:cytochrome c-type biogenesis protein CcmH